MSNYRIVSESYIDPNAPSPNEKQVVYNIDTMESFQHILQSYPIVVVDVWAAYCNPCKMLMPKYEKIAQRYGNYPQHIIFLKDNIEENATIHKPLVTVVPTFFMYVYGHRYKISEFGELDSTVQAALIDVLEGRSPPQRSVDP